MDLSALDDRAQGALQEIVGYLNYSSGTTDSQVPRNFNTIFQAVESRSSGDAPAWHIVGNLLRLKLSQLAGCSPAFADVEQAGQVMQLVFDKVLPAYREFHHDLLFHQTEEDLFRPFFVARVCEAVLHQGAPWTEVRRIEDSAIAELNDFIGHRPVAVLRTPQKIEPYPHEWVRPIPLYIQGAGVAAGRYEQIVQQALAILRTADPGILEDADFELESLDELALDPRAYDFDHPVNKRPNYHFGQWDPHQIDNRGRYRRFVIEQVTLDELLDRVTAETDVPRGELLYEAGAVLAGTLLMASGVSGWGPEAHDSATTLATLLPQIARYRDAYYERLLSQVEGDHGRRLRTEAVAQRQPFARARQHLNQRLARRRAQQLQHVHLAQLYAGMGYPQAALDQVQRVPVAAARIRCETHCRLTAAHHAIARQELPRAANELREIREFLDRGIECGALVDPWNILGFQGNFSIFPALENSIHDPRVEELIDLLRRMFALGAKLESEAAAVGDFELVEQVARELESLAAWWDHFATADVSGVESFSGKDLCVSARQVAAALGAWHQAGAAAGDVGFWRQHIDSLRSAKGFALVVAALIEKGDYVASMALLMQWLSQANLVFLREGEYSFYDLSLRWMQGVIEGGRDPGPSRAGQPVLTTQQAWGLVRKFFDYAEANADVYWQVPTAAVDLGRPPRARERDAREEPRDDPDHDPDGGDVFGAAYENMSYRDSATDGFDGDMLEAGPALTDSELERQAQDLSRRVGFLANLARLWKLACTAPRSSDTQSTELSASIDDALSTWLTQARQNERGLVALLIEAHQRRIPNPSSTRESLLEYDRRRMIQQALWGRIIESSVLTSDAVRLLVAACEARDDAPPPSPCECVLAQTFRSLLRRDAPAIRQLFPELLAQLAQQPLLYLPLAAGGDPEKILAAVRLERVLGDLLAALPRLGLIRETCQLIAVARLMEINHPIGKGAVTEFDGVFRRGYRALVRTLVEASEHWGHSDPRGEPVAADAELIESLESLTESLLRQWLLHSRSLRLSVLEKVADTAHWQALVAFIETYGGDLFTQAFFHTGNLRAILHQGVENWLRTLEAQPDATVDFKLLHDLDRQTPRAEAVAQLEIVLEAILENFAEYKDYNNIATQSDHGNLLYALLDLLRLKARYERVAWNLKPIYLAHDLLVRSGRLAAAELWRRGFAVKTNEAADWHQQRFAELTRKHGVWLPTIADRLAERFVRPLALDRIRALVQPAMEEARLAREPVAFAALEREIGEFVEKPSGAGLDVPAWLLSLEEELERAQAQGGGLLLDAEATLRIPAAPLSYDDVRRQLDEWQQESETTAI